MQKVPITGNGLGYTVDLYWKHAGREPQADYLPEYQASQT